MMEILMLITADIMRNYSRKNKIILLEHRSFSQLEEEV